MLNYQVIFINVKYVSLENENKQQFPEICLWLLVNILVKDKYGCLFVQANVV